MLEKQSKKQKRHRAVRAKISGTSNVPRLVVFRSNTRVYAQLIDDEEHRVLTQYSGKKSVKDSRQIGAEIAKKAIEQKISKIVFDRGGYKYHGNVKSLAEGAREQGLKF